MVSKVRVEPAENVVDVDGTEMAGTDTTDTGWTATGLQLMWPPHRHHHHAATWGEGRGMVVGEN